MADYAVGDGSSLRDAINALYPMTGMGNYNAGYPPSMFPPNAASEPTGSPSVPVPRQRPPVPPLMSTAPALPGQPPNVSRPVALPPGGVNLPPTFPQAQQLYAQRLMQAGGY